MVTNKSLFVTLIVTLTFSAIVFSQQTTGNGTTKSTTAATTATTKSTGTSTPTPTPTTTLSPAEECKLHNKSCEDCIKAANYKCFYCEENGQCMEYPIGSVLPIKLCSLSKARWGVCWVNFEALIITMSVIGGIIILTITCCCIRCCCCRGGNDKKYMKEEAKWERQKTDRKQRSDDRKADRKVRMDEIRKKYGLQKEP